MSNLLLRTLSGIVLVMIVIGSVLWNEYSMLALLVVVFSLGFHEFNLMYRERDRSMFFSFLLTGQLVIVLFYLFFSEKISSAVMMGSAAALLSLVYGQILFSSKATIKEAGKFLSAAVWLAGSLIFFMAIAYQHGSTDYITTYPLILLVMIWVFDIGAYLFGSRLGKTRIAPKISPAKTVEGLLSGIILNALLSILIFRIIAEGTLLIWIILSLIVSLGGTAGDLLESKLKREVDIKDSGQLIPGHGGILDRFDSLLFAAPLFYVALLMMGLI